MRQEIDFHSQKLHVSAVQPVLDAEPAVARVELEVVEVMELRGEGEREVISGVVIHHLELDQAEPEPHQGQWAAHQQDSVSH